MKAMERIDLYKYFGAERFGAEEGFLSVWDCNSEVRPAVLVIAGGGYDHVSNREQDSVARAYLERGYKPFVLHYTTKVKYPIAFFEASMAMAYIRQNAKSLFIDAEKVVGVGFSAGGHLLGCLGILYSDEALRKRWNSVNSLSGLNMENTVKPNAMILSYPVATSEEGHRHDGSFYQLAGNDNSLIERLSLEKSVSSASSPAFIWHTANDSSVPVYGSLRLAMAYEQNGVPFALHIFEKGKHGLSVATGEVCESQVLKEASSGIEYWVELSAKWLSDRL